VNPQALVFDFDGTLVDTMPLHFRAWQVLAKRHGFVFPRERLYAMGGIPTRDILKILRAEQGLSFDPLVVAKEKEETYLALLDEVKPIPEILAIARENFGKLPMAVASGGTRRVIERLLTHLGLGELFAAVVTSEDVVNQKPAPDIFLEAACRLGVPPAQCRAYEDTDLGMAAIRAAGMEAVDVRSILPASGH
jgi:HAD superfamily hydrolase (TIGR01509 family)